MRIVSSSASSRQVVPLIFKNSLKYSDRLSAGVNANVYADEVQKLLDLVPTVDGIASFPNEEGDMTALELDLAAWEASVGPPKPVF